MGGYLSRHEDLCNGVWQWWGEIRLSSEREYVMGKWEFMAKEQAEESDKKISRVRERYSETRPDRILLEGRSG